jgi:hypothetical protein
MASSKSSVDDEILNIVGTFGVSKKDAKVIYGELCKLHTKHKRLDREIVLNAARSSRSKLHKFFEWDDTIAANNWRLRQANKLIGSCKIVVIDKKTKVERSVRCFVSIAEDSSAQGGGTKRSFEPIEDVMNDPQTREQYLNGFIVRMEQLQAEYSFLKEAGPIFKEFARLKRKGV